jgi:ABC-2 type transport system ATP-binding protein
MAEKMNAVSIKNLTKTFSKGKRIALKNISAELPKGKITGVVGPDGAGKTTLLRVIAGLMTIDKGLCEVLGNNTQTESDKIQQNLGYLPQKFGLYEDLSVEKNLSLYADLQGVSKNDPIYKMLLEFSGLGPFQDRLAGNLSGGMKQKLGLMATLLRKPRLLILDEPTLGVDPVSQTDLWIMIKKLNQDGMTIVVSTSYLEEPEHCDYAILLNEGEVLYAGTPETFTKTMEGKTYFFGGLGNVKRTVLDHLLGKNGIIDTIVEGERIKVSFNTNHPDKNPQDYGLDSNAVLVPRKPHFEDAFINALGGVPKRPALELSQESENQKESQKTVEAINLSKTFGTFKAVDNVSFSINKGEIFGLLGPNGAGKSTTFKMLCGLVIPTSGEALVGGHSLSEVPARARSLIGYMAQKFSLYDNLTVLQNMNFFAGLYRVSSPKDTIQKMIDAFDLEDQRNILTRELPLGYKQRLALSCALMHQPRVLFLDEPTSGVDPLTRREFWHQINTLAGAGVSVLVSTHLMDEAEFCDRIGFIYKGTLKAVDTPDGLKKKVPRSISSEPTLKDAFLHFCTDAKQ